MNRQRLVQGYKFDFFSYQFHGSIAVTNTVSQVGPVHFTAPKAISDSEFDAWVSGFLSSRDKGWADLL